MAFELKAEYEFRSVLAWHIVPEGTASALCGTPLAPAAQTRPITVLPHTAKACRTCEISAARALLHLAQGRTDWPGPESSARASSASATGRLSTSSSPAGERPAVQGHLAAGRLQRRLR